MLAAISEFGRGLIKECAALASPAPKPMECLFATRSADEKWSGLFTGHARINKRRSASGHAVVQALLIATCTEFGMLVGVTLLLAKPVPAVKPAIALTS